MFKKMKDRKSKKEIQASLKEFWAMVDQNGKLGNNNILRDHLETMLSNSKIAMPNIDHIYLLEPLVNVVARESFSPQSVALFEVACSKGLIITPEVLKTIIDRIGTHSIKSVDERKGDYWSGMVRLASPFMSTQFEVSAFVYEFLDMLTKNGASWEASVEDKGFQGTFSQYLRLKAPNPQYHTEQQQQVFERYFERTLGVTTETVEVETPILDAPLLAQKLEERRGVDGNNPFNDLIKNTYR